jgi:hypothetical protein
MELKTTVLEVDRIVQARFSPVTEVRLNPVIPEIEILTDRLGFRVGDEVRVTVELLRARRKS